MYVADFYNRIIGHYEVPLTHPGRDRDKGRIWRIVYRGKDGQGGPKPYTDLAKADVPALVKELDNPNLSVRLAATNQLASRPGLAGADAVGEAVARGTPWQKAHGLWVLQRLGGLDEKTLAAAYHAKDVLVRVHAQRILSERPELTPALRDAALAGMHDADAFVQRAAAEALGAHPRPENIAPLLVLRRSVPPADTHLLHAVRIALRDQLRTPEAWQKIGGLVLGEPDQRAIADVCLGVRDAPSAEFLKQYLKGVVESNNVVQRDAHYIVRYGADGSAKWVLDYAAERYAKDPAMQGALLKAVQQASQERGVPPGQDATAFAEKLAGQLLRSPRGLEVQVGIDLASGYHLASAQPALVAVAKNGKIGEAQRKNAVAAAVAIDPTRELAALKALLLSPNEPLGVREQVASALAGTNNAEAHKALVEALQSAPAVVQTQIALGMVASPQGGERLLAAVEKGKASPRLLQDRAVEARLKFVRVKQVDQRLAKLTKGLPPADQRARQLIAQRRDAFRHAKADVAAGLKVFEKHCAACHQVASKGAKIGPQLDGVGIRGVDRLLEDVLDPNRNVDQAFRATTLVLDDGRIVTGLVLREEGEVVVVADAQGKEQRISKAAVQERNVSQMSPMPANFAEQIGPADFNQLLAYLLAQRAKE
jgi:putative heme-binding domain-containing protein